VRQWLMDNTDWDPALRNVNRLYDRLAAAMRLQDRTARAERRNQIEEEVTTQRKRLLESGGLAKLLIGGPEARGEVLGEMVCSFMYPAVLKLQQSCDRSEQPQRNLQVAFALAAYKADHGAYPAKLDDLAPIYIAKVPDDLFSGKALVYRPSG